MSCEMWELLILSWHIFKSNKLGTYTFLFSKSNSQIPENFSELQGDWLFSVWKQAKHAFWYQCQSLDTTNQIKSNNMNYCSNGESPVSAVIGKLYMEVFEWHTKKCSLLFQDLELFLRRNSDCHRWKLLKEISLQPTIHFTKKVKNNNKIAFSTLYSLISTWGHPINRLYGSWHSITRTLWFSRLPVSKPQ